MKSLTLVLFLACAMTAAAQRQVVSTSDAPKAIGPYSQAVIAGGFVFASGQLGMDPGTGALVPGGIDAQTEQALRNLEAVLRAAGSGMDDVVSCTVYLKDLNDFQAMNAVYARHFPVDPPSRATVQVARLPKDGLVEIACTAVRK
jgi:2-iminobutanoate/2-iminopropanoate deaminase